MQGYKRDLGFNLTSTFLAAAAAALSGFGVMKSKGVEDEAAKQFGLVVFAAVATMITIGTAVSYTPYKRGVKAILGPVVQAAPTLMAMEGVKTVYGNPATITWNADGVGADLKVLVPFLLTALYLKSLAAYIAGSVDPKRYQQRISQNNFVGLSSMLTEVAAILIIGEVVMPAIPGAPVFTVPSEAFSAAIVAGTSVVMGLANAKEKLSTATAD
ncbi:MAG: hypothetical protein K0S29_516, partial [Gammaproteobacteria bacterium]|nr:hypothetical protein [Gammaproteobacteria bacterium]